MPATLHDHDPRCGLPLAPAGSLLALEELGLAYRHEPIKPWANTDDAEVRHVDPNARVPVLDDDGLVIWESMAINLYLADRYGGPPLWPLDPRDRALVYQWSVWGQTEVDVRARGAPCQRHGDDAAAKRSAEAERLAALAILDEALAGRPFTCWARRSPWPTSTSRPP